VEANERRGRAPNRATRAGEHGGTAPAPLSEDLSACRGPRRATELAIGPVDLDSLTTGGSTVCGRRLRTLTDPSAVAGAGPYRPMPTGPYSAHDLVGTHPGYPAGGRITLTGSRVGGRVSVRVVDTGEGSLPPSSTRLRALLRVPGRHPCRTVRDRPHRLPRVHAAQGGDLTVESAGPGQGAIFTADLRLIQTAPCADLRTCERAGAEAPGPCALRRCRT